MVRAAAADGNLATGKLVQQRIRKIMDGAIARGEPDPLRGNPADAGLVGAIVPLKRKTVHFRRIKLEDAPAVFSALREAQERATGLGSAELDVWLFMIACASRPSEALHALWSEIDLTKKLLTVSASRLKSGRDHRVPLSALAIEVLERRLKLRLSDMVFAGSSGSAICYTNFALVPKKAAIDAAAPHSWRSAFSIGAARRPTFRGNWPNFSSPM